MRTGLLSFFLAVSLVTADFSLGHGGCYYTPDTGVYWSMDSLVVYSGGIVSGSSGEYVFHGSVWISIADTVMIAPSSTIIFDDTGGDYEFSGWGTLLAQGTAAEEILFTSYNRSPADWFYICPGRGAMEYCRVEYAAWGIVADAASTIVHCTVENNQQGIMIYGGTPYIGHNLVTNNQFCGIHVNCDYGRGSTPQVQCEPIIENNQILGNQSVGISLGLYTGARVRGNTISGSDRGVSCYLYDQSVLTGNTISGNRIGIYCDGESSPNLGDLADQDPEDDGGNHICGNIEYDLYNAGADTIKAEGNFWGTTDIAIIQSHIFGPVDFLPLGETSVHHTTWGRIKSRYR